MWESFPLKNRFMTETNSEIITLWITGTLLFVMMGFFIIGFVLQYRRRQLLNEKQRNERELLFQQEMLEIQAEIRNQSLNYVARELHDNIGQLASYLKMQVELYLRKVPKEQASPLEEIREQSQNLIDQIRGLSRGLNSNNLTRLGLPEMLRSEVDRFVRLEGPKIIYQEGLLPQELDAEISIFIYRVFQEIMNNSLKHSGASEIQITVGSEHDAIELKVVDNGKGFNLAELHQGSGLMNLKDRCELIGASINIESKKGAGAAFLVKLPLQKGEQ